ncbi:MAG: hypothetical protein NTW85_06705 [Methylococcales bacterium]|nr:hypothetical protein [Methylococcales bacterium]
MRNHRNISQKAKQDHPLTAYISFEALKKLCRYYGGTKLEIDLCTKLIRHQRNQLILEAIEKGTTHSQLARQYKISERQIRRIKQQSAVIKS